MTDPEPTLAAFDDDPGRVLAVVADPDDLEYGAAAAVALWTKAGHDVVYVLASRGEAGIDGLAPEKSARVRTQEQIASAAAVGVGVVEFLDHPDGVIDYGVPLRRDIAGAIRRHRPDTLLLFNHRETWAPGVLNSPDHQNVGRAALQAAGDAGNRGIFQDQLVDGVAPHSPKRALAAGSPQSDHAMDVTDGVQAAVASLSEHRAYLAGLGDHPMADPQFLRDMLEGVGQRFQGHGAALAFELYQF